MREEIRQITEVIASHPKTSLAITSFFMSHAWLTYGEPAIKGLTSIIGLAVLVALLIKHILDIKSSLSPSKKSQGKTIKEQINKGE